MTVKELGNMYPIQIAEYLMGGEGSVVPSGTADSDVQVSVSGTFYTFRKSPPPYCSEVGDFVEYTVGWESSSAIVGAPRVGAVGKVIGFGEYGTPLVEFIHPVEGGHDGFGWFNHMGADKHCWYTSPFSMKLIDRPKK